MTHPPFKTIQPFLKKKSRSPFPCKTDEHLVFSGGLDKVSPNKAHATPQTGAAACLSVWPYACKRTMNMYTGTCTNLQYSRLYFMLHYMCMLIAFPSKYVFGRKIELVPLFHPLPLAICYMQCNSNG